MDISEAQIDMARIDYPSSSFEVKEMLEYCRCSLDESLCGAMCLSSLFHLPRAKHTELFTHLRRCLKKGAPLLFSVTDKAYEGYADDWLGASQMYWSTFSPAWYELTLQELGFELLTKFKEVKTFLSAPETMWYMLFRTPDDDPVSFSS
eukprot:TRINITY_DN5452_c0_g1_i4.p1 TRINITY_DN5452_c0_g1~~TRINITY_DN5452_c0_g1_i4.p1  ORF type:complete len:149 (+),score=44.18 TRINITY_DN5452_c0_g1_i4:254-700(+)